MVHRGVRLLSMLQRGHRQQQRQQAAEAEQQLVASCEVAGPGAYVAPEAQGWFAVRVCVLPSRHMAEFPTMFRVRLMGLWAMASWVSLGAEGGNRGCRPWPAHTAVLTVQHAIVRCSTNSDGPGCQSVRLDVH